MLFSGEREKIHRCAGVCLHEWDPIVCISSQLCARWHHIGGNQSWWEYLYYGIWKILFLLREPVVKHLPAQHWKRKMMLALKASAQKWHRSWKCHRSHALTVYLPKQVSWSNCRQWDQEYTYVFHWEGPRWRGSEYLWAIIQPGFMKESGMRTEKNLLEMALRALSMTFNKGAVSVGSWGRGWMEVGEVWIEIPHFWGYSGEGGTHTGKLVIWGQGHTESKVSSRKRQPISGWAQMSFLVLTYFSLQLLFFHRHAGDDTGEGKDQKRKSQSQGSKSWGPILRKRQMEEAWLVSSVG